MASASKAIPTRSILTPLITLKDHKYRITSTSYFSDGQRMISGSQDTTTCQWDLKQGKEIDEARDVCEGIVFAVTVSRDGRWVVSGGGKWNVGELKVCEVEMGMVKKLQGHSVMISCINISVDNTLLTSGSWDSTARIWNLETGKLVAGPFESIDDVDAVRFSTDSKKLTVESDVGKCLEFWDVRIGEHSTCGTNTSASVFWTNNNKNTWPHSASAGMTTPRQSTSSTHRLSSSASPSLPSTFRILQVVPYPLTRFAQTSLHDIHRCHT